MVRKCLLGIHQFFHEGKILFTRTLQMQAQYSQVLLNIFNLHLCDLGLHDDHYLTRTTVDVLIVRIKQNFLSTSSISSELPEVYSI